MFFLPSLDRLFAASFRRLIVLMHVCSRCRARTVAPESTMQLQQWRSVPHSIVSNFIKYIYIPFISPTFTHVHPSAPLLPPPPRSPHTVAALRHSLTQTHCIKCGSQLYSITYIYLFLENDVRRVESATLA